ncbi:MAG TPA: hypothetical protein VL947_10815, partial [Cytophagales bacterium]|nr:hypothetical protein [Cytophagales bacterium]
VLLEYLAGIKVISDVEFVLRQLDTARVIVETHRRREEHAAASQIIPFFGLPQQSMQSTLVPYGMSQGSSSGLEAEHTHPGYEGAPGGLPSMSATDILMQSFKDLMKFEEGQYMLQQAISYMQRSNPLYQLINTNAWSLILGRLLGALNSKNPGEVTAAMNQGDAFLKAQTNVDVAKEVRNQELLPYIKLLAQDYKVDKMQIIEALNDPEPNIRLDMLNRLEWKKRLLLTE